MAKNPDEVVFSVSGSTAVPAQPISLAQAGLREREHLLVLSPGAILVEGECRA